ncbi:hypothetical protein [Thermus albus]|nr:hypothetical protein [Thermus albus]
MRARLGLTGSQVSPVARRPLEEEFAQGCCTLPRGGEKGRHPPGGLPGTF